MLVRVPDDVNMRLVDVVSDFCRRQCRCSGCVEFVGAIYRLMDGLTSSNVVVPLLAL